MLNNIALSQAMSIANMANSNGLVISAIPGSPLATMAGTLACCQTADYVERGPESVMVTSESHPLNAQDHGLETDEIAERVAKFLETNTLRSIREDINPLIREITSAVSAERVRIAESNILGVKIEMVEEPSIYSSAYIESIIRTPGLRNQKNQGLRESLVVKLLADLSEEQLVEIMGTSNPKLNVELAVMVTQQLERSTHANRMYLQAAVLTEAPNLQGENIYLQNGSLLSFLFLRGVIADKHPLLKVDSLSNEERIAIGRAISAYQWEVATHMKMLDRKQSAGNPFVYYREETKTVFVRTKEYLSWIEKEEHTSNAVIGAVLKYGMAGFGHLETEAGLKDAETHFKYKERHMQAKTSSMSDNRVESLTQSMIVSFLNEEAELSETAKETIQEDVAAVREFFSVYRKEPTQTDHQFITQAVCRTIAKGQDVELILSEMQSFIDRKENEEQGLDAAMQFALTRLVARYYARQMLTEKTSGERWDLEPAVKTAY